MVALHNFPKHRHSPASFALETCFAASEVCFVFFIDPQICLLRLLSIYLLVFLCARTGDFVLAQASLLFWTQRTLLSLQAWGTDPVPHTKETLIQGWVKQMLCLYVIKIYWPFPEVQPRGISHEKRGKKN